MKLTADAAAVQRLQADQAGIFSSADLASLLDERHPAALVRRIRALEQARVIARFVRGWYLVPEAADLAVLSQRIAPESYLSFGTVLAEALMVGTMPEKQVWAAKVGRSRIYSGGGCRIVHLGLKPPLLFGFEQKGMVRRATPEKALLDVLYFHLWGRSYPFDIYSDLQLRSIDHHRLREYLAHYRNPKFTVFVEELLDGYR